jgi:hypothetical protein
MILIRYFLIGLIVYLFVRAFVKFGGDNNDQKPNDGSSGTDRQQTKKVSKQVGEYVDYEEVRKK